jgi:hypothetical protein
MPLPHNVYFGNPPIGQRRCPACGFPMSPASIELNRLDHEEQTYECATCAYAETVLVKFC